MGTLHVFASATEGSAENADLFGVLGIDWRLLVLQTISFLIVLWVLKRFVYPPLTRALDERQKTIEASLKAAKEAETQAEKTQAKVEKLLSDARAQASEITATAKTEASSTIEAAEAKAKAKAERLLEQAHEQMEQDVLAARSALKQDTIELVALATEKIVREKVNSKQDTVLIEKTVKEAES